MSSNKQLGKLALIVVASASLGYYFVKTVVLTLPSNTADAFILMIGLIALVVVVYFFRQKKEK